MQLWLLRASVAASRLPSPASALITATGCIPVGKEFSHASKSRMTWGISGDGCYGAGSSHGIGLPWKGVHSKAIGPRASLRADVTWSCVRTVAGSMGVFGEGAE